MLRIIMTKTVGLDGTFQPDGRSPVLWTSTPPHRTPTTLWVGDRQAVQTWEAPLMHAMADAVARPGGDVLEIGFGLNMSADRLMAHGCRSYTVIEAHADIADWAEAWGKQQAAPVTVLRGLWQEVLRDLHGQRFDTVFFDTCPTGTHEDQDWYSAFLPYAAGLTRPGGAFTWFGSGKPLDRTDPSYGVLASSFPHIETRVVSNLRPDPSCHYWRAPSFAFTVCRSAPH
jgi:hypothetical protein